MIVQNLKSRNIYCSIQGKSTSGDKDTRLLEDLFPLIGVTNLQIQWQHEVGVRQGITANFLQPWYNKPVEIEIQGESYIGMFGGQSLSADLAKQQDDKKKQVDGLDQIKKALKITNDGVVSLGQGVLDSVKFSTGISLQVGSEDYLRIFDDIAKDISESDMAAFFGKKPDYMRKYNKSRLDATLAAEGKSKEEWRQFVTKFSSWWNSKNLPVPFQKKNLGSLVDLADGVSNKARSVQKGISESLKKLIDLMQQSLGPKEDKTVNNLKNIISYYRYGPFQYKGDNYTNLEHVLVLENEPGQNSSGAQTGSFSTFIGVIRDFSYQESIENPFVYDYTVRFIGLPDTQGIISKSKEQAKIDKNRGGITLTFHSSKDILKQGIGLLQQIPKPSVPSIIGLK